SLPDRFGQTLKTGPAGFAKENASTMSSGRPPPSDYQTILNIYSSERRRWTAMTSWWWSNIRRDASTRLTLKWNAAWRISFDLTGPAIVQCLACSQMAEGACVQAGGWFYFRSRQRASQP